MEECGVDWNAPEWAEMEQWGPGRARWGHVRRWVVRPSGKGQGRET
jgi:hypothetical protein